MSRHYHRQTRRHRRPAWRQRNRQVAERTYPLWCLLNPDKVIEEYQHEAPNTAARLFTPEED